MTFGTNEAIKIEENVYRRNDFFCDEFWMEFEFHL